MDSNGNLNTFQLVLITDGNHYYIIFNLGSCETPNALSYVQIAASSYLNWNNVLSSSTATDYEFLSYGGGSYWSGNNACFNGQYIFAYPTQTVICYTPNNSLPWYSIFAIAVGCLIFVCCCCGLTFLILSAIAFLIVKLVTKKKKNVAKDKQSNEQPGYYDNYGRQETKQQPQYLP